MTILGNALNLDPTTPLVANLGGTGTALGNASIYSIHAISTTAILDATDFGKEIVCTGSSAYAVTLPTVTSNAEKYIDFSIRTTSNALVTITPASGTIMGQSTFILGSNEGCRVVTDGTNWFVTNLYLMPVYAYVSQNTAQSITDNTLTKITLDTKLFDIGTFFDAATNHRYQPLYPGKYMVSGLVTFQSLTSINVQTVIQKNGSTQLAASIAPVTANVLGIPTSTIVTLNGSTDFIELFGYQHSGGAISTNATAVSGSTAFVFMSISRLGNI